MRFKLSIVIKLIALSCFQLYTYGQEPFDMKLADEYDGHPKYVVGLSYYSHFRDYQLGDFYESKIDFSGELGYSLFSSAMIGINLHITYLSDKAKSNKDGASSPRVSLGPFFRYYLIKNFYCESGVGIGYGFHSFRNDEGDLVRDWENIRIHRFHVSAGYDIPVTKSKSLVIRPSVYYMRKKEKIPEYPESSNNNKISEIGLSISFIINIYTPKN